MAQQKLQAKAICRGVVMQIAEEDLRGFIACKIRQRLATMDGLDIGKALQN